MTAASNEEAVYLSRQDVKDLAHYNFYIPINRGFHQEHVDEHYAGWSWRELYPVIRTQAPLSSRHNDLSPRHLPEGALGVLVHRNGTVELDDGSLDHPAKAASWSRGRWGRLSEQCVYRARSYTSPVIVHAPHTSLHIPNAVRAELCIDGEALDEELAAMTDTGATDILDALSDSTRSVGGRERSTIVTATMSRLVFDPERFADGDPMDAVGMGLVYTRRADGTPLRRPLAPERLAWYRAQHRAYTESMERVVDTTLQRCGRALIIDLHSYPATPLRYEDQTAERPEVCIGTDPFHTPGWLTELAVDTFSARFHVGIDSPFSGAYVPGRLYRADDRVASVMIEVRRDVLATPSGVDTAAAAVSCVLEGAASLVVGHGVDR